MLPHPAASILTILDQCAVSYSFPAMDNGHVYLAATRLALFRSATDWAMTVEAFGFSLRAGVPDVCIASSLARRELQKICQTPGL